MLLKIDNTGRHQGLITSIEAVIVGICIIMFAETKITINYLQ